MRYKLLLSLVFFFLGLNNYAQEDYLITLYENANNAFEQKDYKSAVKYYKELADTMLPMYGKESDTFSDVLYMLGLSYDHAGNYEEAINKINEVLVIQKKNVGYDNTRYIQSLQTLSILYRYNNYYKEAIPICKELSKFQEELLGREHPDYIKNLHNLESCYLNIGSHDEAIRVKKEILEILKETLGYDHPEYAMRLNNLASEYSNQGNYSEAIRVNKDALEIIEKVLGQEHPNYALCLHNLAFYYSHIGDYTTAVQLYKKVLEIRKRILGTEHPDYATTLDNLAVCYSDIGNNNEALLIYKEVLDLREKTLGREHPDYTLSLNNLASLYSNIGNFNEAIRINKEVLELREKILGGEHPLYAKSLNNLASCYSSIGNYNDAMLIYNKALEIQEKLFGHEHPDCATTLTNLAYCYYEIGDYGEAIRIQKDILEIKEKVLGHEHPDYASGLDNLASSYSAIGNYTEAIRINNEALEIREKILGREHPDYVLSLNNLAYYNSMIGNYDESIRVNKEVLELRGKILGFEHPAYAQSLNNLASCFAYIGNYNEALSIYKESLQIREKKLGREHPDYMLSLSNLADCYFRIGNYSEAILSGKEVLEITEKILGQEHPDYAMRLGNLAFYHLCNGSYKDFENAWNSYIILHKKTSTDQLQSMTFEDKNTFWNKENGLYEFWSPYFAYICNTPQMLSSAYDASLFSKGLLLGVENETKRIIQNSNDKELLALYDDFVLNKVQLNKYLEMPIKERPIETDSLSKVVEKQERELMSRSKAFGNIKKNMLITWQDVQNKLNDDDIAIEFMSFDLNNDSTMYVALTLKKGYEHPKLTPLFVEKQLNVIRPSRYYKGNGLYNLIWKPVDEELTGVKNVYFSPTGKLYNINIEVLPEIASHNEGRNYYRLSSTRQLAYISEEYEIKNEATVYGGLRYSATDDGNQSQKQGSIGSSRGVIFQSGWSYLPGTLTEAESVCDAMESSEISSTLYTGAKGTEESFKSLDGSRQKYLHIATHGFYYTDRDSVSMKSAGFRLLNDEIHNHNIEDKSLTRSGLLLADCNDALTGQPIGYNREDGILYGNEIAKMDLRGLDLLTLSACETGIGDISGEGVFGLQRAFKKAGAQSIVMSLWKVDDDATRIFMTRFYQNYIGGNMSKATAIRAAQQFLREYEEETTGHDGNKIKIRKYDNPIYWAAFIILDPA